MITTRDVGRRAGVSALPVSRAVEGAWHANREAKARVEARVNELDRSDDPEEDQYLLALIRRPVDRLLLVPSRSTGGQPGSCRRTARRSW
jgi:Bacterial regulatory proteins, lacI family